MSRLGKLRQMIEAKGLDVLLISYPTNLRYISGFTGSTAWSLISADKAIIAVDFRYIEQAKTETHEFEVIHVRGELASWLPKLVSDFRFKNIGFEAEHILFSTYDQICKSMANDGSKLIPTIKAMESIRIIKEPQELTHIEAATKLADSAMSHAKSLISPGKTEKEIAWEIERFVRENGSEAVPFDIIVASGPNAAMPHMKPTDKYILEGEPIVVDMGARINGYCSDLSRTFYMGTEDNMFSKIYDTVLGAQLAGLATIVPDLTGDQADRLSRTIIEQAGYNDAFGHGLGHGVGLETHEAPRLAPNACDILADGMVFTIEPGVYIPEWGGVRIEDTVVAENGKIRSLTKADKIARIQQ